MQSKGSAWGLGIIVLKYLMNYCVAAILVAFVFIGSDTARAQVKLSEDQQKTVNLALDGNAQSQSDVGIMFYNGVILPKNDQQAYNWFKISAEQGYAPGAFNLAMMYLNGIGVEANEKEAVKWLEFAAQKGQTDAQLALGLLASLGNETTPPDDALALAWLQTSASKGNGIAIGFIDLMLPSLSEETAKNADTIAKDLAKRVADGLADQKQ